MYSDDDSSGEFLVESELLLDPRLSPTKPNIGRGLVPFDKVKGRENLFNTDADNDEPKDGDVLDLSPQSIKQRVR